MSTMSVITIPLKTRIFEEDIINKRMKLCCKVYNSMLRDKLKDLRKMELDKDYKAAKEIIFSVYKEENQENANKIKKSKEYKEAKQVINQKMKEYNFSEYGFASDVLNYIKPFSSNITATLAIYSISKPMWGAFEKYFFSNGKMVHYKSFDSVNSVSSDGKAGLKLVGANKKATRHPESPFNLFVMYGSNRGGKVITMPLVVKKKDYYMQEMICNDIKVVRLVRRKIKGHYKYYVQLTVDNPPAIKFDRETGEIKNPINEGNVGIFIDTRKVTICSKEGVRQIELIDRNQLRYESIIADLNRYLDTSRRLSNPDNYNEDGTIKKGKIVDGQKTKLTWTYSNNYKKARNKVSDIQRKLAEERKIRSGEISNLILSLGNNIVINKYNFKAAQERKKETEVNEKGQYLSKAKAGKAISYSAPSQLLTIIDNKLTARGYNEMQRIEVEKDFKVTDENRILKAQEFYKMLNEA